MPAVLESQTAHRTGSRPTPISSGFPTGDLLEQAGDPPDGTRLSKEAFCSLTTTFAAEWVDGRLSYLPMASEIHQIISGFFYDLLRQAGRAAGRNPLVLFAPFFVEVPNRVREPDLVMLLDRNDARRGPKKWAGADLAVEIVSPDDPDRDLVEKRREYADVGISEYWIVDPRPGFRRVAVLSLEDGVYRGDFIGEGGTAESRLLPGLSAAVRDCLDPPE